MTTLALYRTALEEQVPDQVHLSGTDHADRAINKALALHSRHKPLAVVADVVGDGGFDYDLSTKLASWDEDFSQVTAVEYPIDDTDEDKDLLAQGDDWQVYAKPAGKELHFLHDTPKATASFRVTYTARHTISATACSVEAMDTLAVQTLAASFYCRVIAAKVADAMDSTIAADSVDRPRIRSEYSRQAKEFLAEYYELMGIQPDKAKPATAYADWDSSYADGSDRLTHGRRRR